MWAGIIAIVIAGLFGLTAIAIGVRGDDSPVIPSMPNYPPRVVSYFAVPVAIEEGEEAEWSEYHADAFAEYADEFTLLFNSLETKWSKNGRLMMRAGDSGSFRFVKKG